MPENYPGFTPFEDYVCPTPPAKGGAGSDKNMVDGAPTKSDTQIGTVQFHEVAGAGKKPFMNVAGGDTSSPGEKK